MYITIGRNPQSDIVISGYDTVSFDHAVIEYENGKFLFIDDSTNGSVVNGERINHESRPVTQGDPVMLAGVCSLDWNLVLSKVSVEPAGIPVEGGSRPTMLRTPEAAPQQAAYQQPAYQQPVYPQEPVYHQPPQPRQQPSVSPRQNSTNGSGASAAAMGKTDDTIKLFYGLCFLFLAIFVADVIAAATKEYWVPFVLYFFGPFVFLSLSLLFYILAQWKKNKALLVNYVGIERFSSAAVSPVLPIVFAGLTGLIAVLYFITCLDSFFEGSSKIFEKLFLVPPYMWISAVVGLVGSVLLFFVMNDNQKAHALLGSQSGPRSWMALDYLYLLTYIVCGVFAVLALLIIIAVLAHDSGILEISDLGTVSIFVVSIIPSALAWTFAMKFSDKVKTLVPTAQGSAAKDKKKTVV